MSDGNEARVNLQEKPAQAVAANQGRRDHAEPQDVYCRF